MTMARAAMLATVLAASAPAHPAAAHPAWQARPDGVIDPSGRIRDPRLTDRVAVPCDGRCRPEDGRPFRFKGGTLF